MSSELIKQIKELEEELLEESVRKSADRVAQLLADEFIEFGSSGFVYDKARVIADLQHESSGLKITAQDFIVKQLAPAVVLVTYRSVKHSPDGAEVYGLRSSIWKQFGEEWKMVFHQGTKVPKN